jgi:Cu-Zn family superoxide dismutase
MNTNATTQPEGDDMKNITRILTTAAAVTAAGAAVMMAPVDADDGTLHAAVTLVDASGAQVGTVHLVEDASGSLHVNVKVAGLTPGEHGIHIHATGSCTPDFAAAGGHHNPYGVGHGQHAGDLPNLAVNVAGRGSLVAVTDHASLSDGPVSVFDANGSSVVVHALPDDFVTNPAGNSGARIACGVIEAE